MSISVRIGPDAITPLPGSPISFALIGQCQFGPVVAVRVILDAEQAAMTADATARKRCGSKGVSGADSGSVYRNVAQSRRRVASDARRRAASGFNETVA